MPKKKKSGLSKYVLVCGKGSQSCQFLFFIYCNVVSIIYRKVGKVQILLLASIQDNVTLEFGMGIKRANFMSDRMFSCQNHFLHNF